MLATAESFRTIVGLAALSGWIAWRYSRLPVSQDEGLWMLWGFTGARPYIDQVDCKPPGIHLWCWLLARITGFNPYACRLLQQVALGAIAITAYCLSGNVSAALCFIIVAQSAWFQGYFAWVEATSAGLWFLAFFCAPSVAMAFLVLAWLFNLKLVLPTIVFALLRGWFAEVAVALFLVALAALVLHIVVPRLARALWYGCVTVPKRLVQMRARDARRTLPQLDAKLLVPLLLIVALAISAAMHGFDASAWAAAAVYLGVNAAGRVWRPYHWIPLAPVLAFAALPIALTVVVVDLVTNGLYLGDIVARQRPVVSRYLKAAQKIGNGIFGNAGRLWVYGQFTQLYIYARARPALLPVEQVEIRHVITERREQTGTIEQVDTLIICPGEIRFLPEDFRPTVIEDGFMVLKRTRDSTEAPQCHSPT
jgi:hypothetical protein